MSNQVLNIMAASYYDQLCEGFANFQLGGFDPSLLQGSLNNPLQTYRLLCLDVETEISFESEELAGVAGVPADWFDVERLNASADEALKALGVMALVYLSCLRNEAMKYGFKVDTAENALEAKNTFIEVLQTNNLLGFQ